MDVTRLGKLAGKSPGGGAFSLVNGFSALERVVTLFDIDWFFWGGVFGRVVCLYLRIN